MGGGWFPRVSRVDTFFFFFFRTRIMPLYACLPAPRSDQLDRGGAGRVESSVGLYCVPWQGLLRLARSV